MRRQQGQKGPTQRQLRVGEIIRHAFADMLMRSEIADPAFDGHNVTITEVRVSPDLRNATVYALPFGSDNAEALRRRCCVTNGTCAASLPSASI